MPTVLSHPAVPFAIRLGLGADVIPKRLLVAGALGSVLPDLDILAFFLGIPYEHQFGHRGFSHSLAFATFVALAGGCGYRRLETSFGKAFTFLLVATASHGVLDAFTDGGLGVALFWPWSKKRYFSPFRPIRVSPISISAFLSYRGVQVLLSEILWVWLPCILTGAALSLVKRGA